MIRRLFPVAATALALGAALGPAARASSGFGQGLPEPPAIKSAVSATPASLESPGSGVVHLVLEIPSGYHLFAGEALSVRPAPLEGVSFGRPAYPKGTKEEDFEVLRGRVGVEIPVTLTAGVKGPLKGSLILGWQGCQDFGDKVCFLPQKERVPFVLPVTSRAAPAKGPPTAGVSGGGPTENRTPPTAESGASSPGGVSAPDKAPGTPSVPTYGDRFREAALHNIPLALLLAFLFGILSSLTPCVYPVIPITVAYIGSRSEGKGRGHGFLLSLAFVLGLAAVYATLGALSARAGAVFGSLTQTPWIGLPVAALFFVLSLSMFNLFELKTPAALTTRIERTKQQRKGGGFVGAFLIGALSGLVASPCIGPLILAILVVVAATGSTLLGFVYLFVFALGMGVLFVVIGSFSGVLASLPKSGGWMDGVRVFFGALILAAAFYFAGLYLPRSLFGFASGTALGFIEGYLVFGARKHFFPVFLRIVAVLLCAGALVAVIPLLPPVEASPSSVSSTAVPWESNLESALARAGREKKPVLMDFRADWCVACVELEKKTWPKPEVQRALARVVPLRLDMTRNTGENRELQTRFGVVGLPTVLLFQPGEGEVARFVGFKHPSDVVKWIQKAEADLEDGS